VNITNFVVKIYRNEYKKIHEQRNLRFFRKILEFNASPTGYEWEVKKYGLEYL